MNAENGERSLLRANQTVIQIRIASAVQVTVEGDPKQLRELKVSDIRAEVNLTGIESARGMSKRIDVITPQGVTYVRVIPDTVEVIIPPRD